MKLKTKHDKEECIYLCVLIAAAAFTIVLPAIINSESFIPLNSLWRFPPWNKVLAPTINNGLQVDQLLDFWPWRIFLRSEMIAHRFPLWNPLISSGVPFVGNVQTAIFFPLTILLPFLSLSLWSIVSTWIKLFTAGIFTSLYVRRLGASRQGSALAGITFMLSGFMIAWLGHPHTNAACLLPALFWSIQYCFDSDIPRNWSWVSIIAGLIFLGGHPPTAIHIIAVSTVYVLAIKRTQFWYWSLAVIGGLGLAAPALFPYLEYLSLSSSFDSSLSLSRWATHLSPGAFIHLFMPLVSGLPSDVSQVLSNAYGMTPESNFMERAAWVGIPSIFFASSAMLVRRDVPTRLFGILAAFTLASAFGLFPIPYLWRVLPGFSIINPTRLLLIYCFCMSVLAGLGCDDKPIGLKSKLIFILSVIGFAILLIDVLNISSVWREIQTAQRGFVVGQIVIFLVEMIISFGLLVSRNARTWAPIVALVFLVRVGIHVNETSPKDRLYPMTPSLAVAQVIQGSSRVFGLGWALAPNLGMTLGLKDARGQDFNTLRRYEELITGRFGSFDFYTYGDQLPSVASLLAISTILATPKMAMAVPSSWIQVHEGDMSVYRAPVAISRALFVPFAINESSDRTFQRVRSENFDPSKIVIFDDMNLAPLVGGGKGQVDIIKDCPNEIEIDVNSDGPGWVLLLDNWYPGWRATVNQFPAVIRRADYTFRAVAVRGGNSRIRFVYTPYSLWIGVIVSVFTALMLILFNWQILPTQNI